MLPIILQSASLLFHREMMYIFFPYLHTLEHVLKTAISFSIWQCNKLAGIMKIKIVWECNDHFDHCMVLKY